MNEWSIPPARIRFCNFLALISANPNETSILSMWPRTLQTEWFNPICLLHESGAAGAPSERPLRVLLHGPLLRGGRGGEEQQVVTPARPGAWVSTLPRPVVSWKNLPGTVFTAEKNGQTAGECSAGWASSCSGPAAPSWASWGGSFLCVFLMWLFVTAICSEREADVSCNSVLDDEIICRETFT